MRASIKKRRDKMQAGQRGGQPLVIPSQPSEADRPGKRTLHDHAPSKPSSRAWSTRSRAISSLLNARRCPLRAPRPGPLSHEGSRNRRIPDGQWSPSGESAATPRIGSWPPCPTPRGAGAGRRPAMLSFIQKGFLMLFSLCSCTPPFTFADHLGQVRGRTNLEGARLHTRADRVS